MAKILVADDNSNIQKMVGFALKDQGIEVIAVGNGEAAVRKISDVRPDLVLADVFMPVRNGYEVCQYVKSDQSLSHIPVILLVGAFDPLDEQEAQRVGVDGVLKKPFVPPEPLISMVRSALSRAGAAAEREAAAARTAAAKPDPRAMAASLPPNESFRDSEPAEVSAAEAEPRGHFAQDFVRYASPLKIPAEEQPLAFGSLLETKESPPENGTAAAEAESEADFLVPRNPQLEESRAWNAPHQEEGQEETEEGQEEPSWRPDVVDEGLEEGTPTAVAPDWRDTVLSRVTKNAESRPEEVSPARDASGIQAESAAPETPASLEVAGAPNEAGKAAPATETRQESWFSVPTNPWDAEVQKANRLADTWNMTATAAPEVESAEPVRSQPVGTAALAEEAVAAVALEEQAHDDPRNYSPGETVPANEAEASWAALAEPPAPETIHAPPPEPLAPTDHATTAAIDVDSVVARVLEKMTPEVVERVTREILKPVVEAIVRGELKK